MVHRSSDTRLLNNLISHEKDYSKHLTALLDSSHASCNSLTVFAASSPPPSSQLILTVAGSLHSVDDALRGYAAAVERWRQHLAGLKDLEDEVGNIMRDREILVTRLLKVSTKSKPPSNNRDSIMSFSHQSSSTLDDPTSMSYLPNSLEPTFTAPNKKLQAAQAELQACEAHLAIKERELDLKRSMAVREGLQTRFRALAECGSKWTQIARDVDVRLFGGQNSIPTPGSPPPVSQPIFSSESKPLPMPDMPDLPVIHTPIPIRPPPTAIPLPQSPAPESELSHASSSLAPSQSASQVGTITQSSSAPLHDHIYSNLEAQSGTTASPAPVPASPLKRHTLPHRITEEDLHQSTSSDDDGEEPVRVVENPRYRNGLPNHEPFTSSPKKDKGGLFGSIRGLFHRHSKDGSSSSVGRDDDQESVSVGRGRGGRRIPLFGAGGKKNSTHRWDDESPVRPVLPTRRVSEDIVPTTFPPVRDRVMSMSDVSPVSGNTSPSGKKLKKKGEMKAIAEETRGKKKKAKRRRSASLDPGVLREPNEAEDIVDLGRKEKESSLVRAGEWVDSQKRQETPPERKPSVKKKKQSGVGSGLISAASASTPVLPASWSVPESWAVNDVTIVPVEGGGLSKSSSTRSRVQSTVATPSGPKAPRHTRSSSTERIPTSSTMPAITLTHTTATTTKAQKRASAPVTFSNGSTSLMSIVEDVTRANRETWSTGGSSPGLVKSVGGTVKPSALVEVKAPRSLSAKDLEGVDVFSVSKEVNSSSSLFLPKAPSIPKENGSVRSLPLPGKSVATVTQQQQPVVQQRPSSVSPEQRKPVVPLRSALKGSRTPSPAQPQPQPSAPPQPEAFTSQLSPSSPQPIEGLPVTMNGKGKDVDSDTDSISSYETGHEVPVPVDAPPIPIISPPPHVTPSRSSPPPPPPPPHRQNGLTIPVPPSDLSASSSSTVHQGEKPKRRKSVRVSLKPQFSPTPPAVDDDGEPSWYENENEAGDGPYAPQPHDQNQHQNRHENHEIQKVKRNRDYERDMWQDSSEEEENGEYASARKLLMRGFLRGKKDAKS